MPNVLIATSGVSESARLLTEALIESGIQTVRRNNRGSNARRNRLEPSHIINWGCATATSSFLRNINCHTTAHIFNPTQAVNNAANKLTFFHHLPRTRFRSTIPWTTSRSEARGWLSHGDRVYCRTQLRGHSGQGIVVARDNSQLVDAPLYTKGVDTRYEFRLHVVGGVVIDGVRKAFNSDVPEEERNTDIMNHSAGTIFVRAGEALRLANLNFDMLEDAVACVRALGLDFGAVDVIQDRQGNHHILEVNTACGLTGTTLTRYTRALKALVEGQPQTPWSFNEFQQQQENTTMNIATATVGRSIIFNAPESSNITTLTRGSTYVIERIGREVIYIRNNRGRILGYRPHHFVEAPVATPVPVAPTVPAAPATPTYTLPVEMSELNVNVNRDDPLRIALLEDGSYINPTGSAILNFDSNVLTRGERYDIVHILKSMEQDILFVGIELPSGDVVNFRSTHLTEGTLGTVSEDNSVSMPNSLLDSVGGRLMPNATVRVIATTNNHLQVGEVVIYKEPSGDTNAIVTKSNGSEVTINPSRLRVMTRTEVTEHTQQQRAITGQAYTDFTVANQRYRFLTSDLRSVQDALRPFVV
jgi:hypothetical protein